MSRTIGAVALLVSVFIGTGWSDWHRSDPSEDAVLTHLVTVQPCRLADTRIGDGVERLDAHTIRVQAGGRCGLPASPTAVEISIVSVESSVPGFTTAYPAGTRRPLASNVNYRPGQIRANAAITEVGPNGSFDVYTTSGDVVIDTTGAFVEGPATSAGRLVPIPPRRLLDTRTATAVAPGSTVHVPLPDDVGSDAIALSLVITVTESEGPGFVTTYPSNTQRPLASVLNIDHRAATVAVGGIFRVSPDGLTIFLSGGGHVIVDETGWFTGPSERLATVGSFLPVAPHRVLDTREPSNDRSNPAPPIPPGGTVIVPTEASMTAAVNLTSVEADEGFLTAYPAGAGRPPTSVLNTPGGGDVVADFAIVPTSAAGMAIFSQRTTHLVVDIEGWFTTTELLGGEAVAPDPVATTSPTMPTNATTNATTSTTTTTTTTIPPSTTTTTTTTIPPSTTTTTTSTTTTTTIATTTTTAPHGSHPIVYLTFDDGPLAGFTTQLLDMLDRHHVNATFFVVGDNVHWHPEIAADIVQRGNAIGNHSDTHPDLATLTSSAIALELTTADGRIAAATGIHPRCMRPPYGSLNSTASTTISGLGLVPVLWTNDTNDWDTAVTTVSDIIATLDSVHDGSIVLMHDFVPGTLVAVDRWLSDHSTDYEFRTIPSC